MKSFSCLQVLAILVAWTHEEPSLVTLSMELMKAVLNFQLSGKLVRTLVSKVYRAYPRKRSSIFSRILMKILSMYDGGTARLTSISPPKMTTNR